MSLWLIGIVAAEYMAAGLMDFWNGHYAWGMVWCSYAVAGIGILLARLGYG